MTLPLSYLAFQVLALAAGLVFFRVVCHLVRRPGGTPWRRTLREGSAMLVGGFALLLLGRIGLGSFGSTALFLPVGALFYAFVAFGAPSWIGRGVRERCWFSASVGLGLVVLALDMLFLEPERLEVTRCEVRVEGPVGGTRSIRIAHVSDLQTVGFAPREARALAAIEAFHPDLVLLTGDYATGGEDAQQDARSFLEQLHAPAGIFAVRGDAENSREMRRLVEGLPIRWLVNEGERVEVAGCELFIAGLERGAERPAKALRDCPPGATTILLSHAPDPVLDLERAGYRVDLMLSGHTHGGQICLPALGPPLTLSSLPRSEASRLHQRHGSVKWLNVSRGLGMEGRFAPRMRFLCPPQITLIDLRVAELKK